MRSQDFTAITTTTNVDVTGACNATALAAVGAGVAAAAAVTAHTKRRKITPHAE